MKWKCKEIKRFILKEILIHDNITSAGEEPTCTISNPFSQSQTKRDLPVINLILHLSFAKSGPYCRSFWRKWKAFLPSFCFQVKQSVIQEWAHSVPALSTTFLFIFGTLNLAFFFLKEMSSEIQRLPQMTKTWSFDLVYQPQNSFSAWLYMMQAL